MAKQSKEDLLKSIREMSVLELVDLIKAIEEEFGVSAAAVAAPAAAPVASDQEQAAAEKTEFEVVLKEIGANKINVIKAVRAITELGLKEAKDLVESAPASVNTDVSKEDSEKMKKQLEEAGATVELK